MPSARRSTSPYVLLLIADAGVEKAPVDDRSIPFWLFTAVAVLGAASTVVRLRRMVNAHHRRALPGWTRFLGALLVMYGLYVAYCVADGAVP